MDMSAIITPKSDQINADDLSGGRTVTVTVTEVQIKGGQEQPISIRLAETDKFYRPCKSMCRVLAQGWGLDSAQYVGRSMTLYTDPTVKFGPLAVGGIRISHMTHLDGPMVMALTATKGVKKSYKVLPLEMPRQAGAPKQADAEAALRRATSLDELKVTWSNKAMAPHRAALQPVLDEMKAALAEPADHEEGPSDEQRGQGFTDVDPAAAKEAEILAAIDAAGDIDQLGATMAENRGHMAVMHEDATARIWAASNKRKAALAGGKK